MTMRFRLILISIMSFMVWLTAQAAEPDYWRSDSVKVMRLLKEASAQKAGTNYMLFFARKLAGVPYVAKTLEKNDSERLVVNLRQLDCTTFVETVLALKRCMDQGKRTFDNFCDNLRLIRYRGGEVSYPNRLHYFTSWIADNTRLGIVKDIQGPNPPFTATQRVNANYMTTHVSLYPMLVGHPEWVPLIRQMEDSITGLTFPYIPKNRLADSPLLRQTIRDGDILVILTSKNGLDTSHLGIAVWHKDGLHKIDASAVYHKVIEDPMTFSNYMARHRTHTGIRVVRAL